MIYLSQVNTAGHRKTNHLRMDIAKMDIVKTELGGATATNVLFRDFPVYAAWWAYWMGLVNTLRSTGEVGFGPLRSSHAVVGAVLGIICAVGFTLLQNKFNARREKVKTLLFAIWTLIPMTLIVALVVALTGAL
jgi:hypothetical protein